MRSHPVSCPPRARRRAAPILLALAALVAWGGSAEARTRTFCTYEPFYSGKQVECGGHLEPVCTSGNPCNDGAKEYSGSPFPITIDCPTIKDPITGIVIKDIPDVTVTGGCYDYLPTCAACGGVGEPPCPVEAEPICTAGCDAGLEPDPTTTLCESPGTPGSPCGPGYPCGPGLTCDPFSGFKCVAKVGVGDSCADPFVQCQDGLQCTLALVCSHDPALEGETCDATAPCADGLYCKPGIPQICNRYRKPGEGCSVINPCMPGASCEACFTDGCNAPLQCFWNSNNGAITEQQCRKLYSEDLSQAAKNVGGTMTYATGDGIGALVAESQAFGIAYGQNGEYGCYTTFCYGVSSDVSAEAFVAVGLYQEFKSVDGPSFVNTQEAQIPGDLLNFSTSQVFQRFGTGIPDLGIGDLIGTEDAISVGGGLNPAPFTAGSFLCDTTLDPLKDAGQSGPPPPPPPLSPANEVPNADFDVDLSDWACTNGGTCAWSEDDPVAATDSGSGEVTSPPPGSLSTYGRLESACVAVDPGATVELSAWVKTIGAQQGQLYALWTSSTSCVGGVVANDLLASSPPDNTWRQITLDTTPPAGAVAVSLQAIASRDGSDVASSTRIDRAYVPEPSAGLAGWVAGASLLGLLRRRRRRAG